MLQSLVSALKSSLEQVQHSLKGWFIGSMCSLCGLVAANMPPFQCGSKDSGLWFESSAVTTHE